LAAQPVKKTATLGIIVSTAPEAALLQALSQLRPQFETTLEQIPGGAGRTKCYRVAVALTGDVPWPHEVSPWLSVKSALMAQFPADKPGAVTAIDP
jgi:hypothetical protein